jgi:hypothetical protein
MDWHMGRLIKYSFLFILLINNIFGADWYVSSSGSGNGSSTNTPGSLSTALAHTGWAASIAAGDTVWLRGGTYSNSQWTVSFSGSSGNLVTWRSYTNELARIDRQWRFSSNRYHRFRDIEFYDSKKSTYGTGYPYSQFDDSSPGYGNEWINCIIHDIHLCWGGTTAGSLVRGCILWYVGENVLEHTIYGGILNFSGNISGWVSGYDVNTSSVGVTVKSNIFFGSGITSGSDTRQTIIEMDGGDIEYNYTYTRVADAAKGGAIRIGYTGGTGYNGKIANNFVVGRSPLYILGSYSSLIITNNILHMQSGNEVLIHRETSTGSWTINNNKYTARDINVGFEDDGGNYTFAQWKSNFSYDANSVATNNALPADTVYIIPNQDVSKRAHIAVYNFSSANNVSVDVSSVLSNGDIYYLYSAQNYNAGAIKVGL